MKEFDDQPWSSWNFQQVFKLIQNGRLHIYRDFREKIGNFPSHIFSPKDRRFPFSLNSIPCNFIKGLNENSYIHLPVGIICAFELRRSGNRSTILGSHDVLRQLPTPLHREGNSNPTRMNVNETLRTIQQFIEGLARHFQGVVRDTKELKKGKGSATESKEIWIILQEFSHLITKGAMAMHLLMATMIYRLKVLIKFMMVVTKEDEDSMMNLFKGEADDMNQNEQETKELFQGPITKAWDRKIKEHDDRITNGMLEFVEEAIEMD
ncbi:hypothetical protein M9H77_13082 [Catharanthus roseus]|uniref:Uncharacterized protein n=1 Tax=Catharanthus roseus TaxID=4058 RepID=A0ACC0BJD5_CATRO|nr:hypothetical protein M9H77_13082 [Catharanthus roseus]